MSAPQTLASLAEALPAFLERWADPYLAHDLGVRLNCGEVEALAGLLTALGRPKAAEAWISGHAVDDDCGDAHCLCEECNPPARPSDQ